jgi:hypothetical protein
MRGIAPLLPRDEDCPLLARAHSIGCAFHNISTFPCPIPLECPRGGLSIRADPWPNPSGGEITMRFEQFIESVLRLHNIGQPPPNEQGRPIGEPSKDLLGDAQQQEPVASSESLNAASDEKTG